MIDGGMVLPVIETSDARKKLEDVARKKGLFAPDRKAPLLRVADGRPADEIIRAVEREGTDLIVMGTHGRRGFKRLMLGSVAEEVVRRATCPVLTVKPAQVAAPAFVP
jgi:nucleotide-binding universal stress UspA family protein